MPTGTAISGVSTTSPSTLHMATLGDIKDILQLTVTTYDNYIVTMIPLIQDYIIKFTHNDFTVNHSYTGLNLAFVNGGSSSDSITNADSDFDYYKVMAGPVYVEGSMFNDGHHIVTTSAAGTLTLYSTGKVVNEDSNSSSQYVSGYPITIKQVRWPDGIKFAVAQLINMHINNPNGINSESLGDYSYTMPTSYTENPVQASKILRQWNKIRGY